LNRAEKNSVTAAACHGDAKFALQLAILVGVRENDAHANGSRSRLACHDAVACYGTADCSGCSVLFRFLRGR
jgi:hypothetical protein